MTPQRPHFSIIVPTHDRPIRLAACLRALSQIDYARDCFEVIIVNDGSKNSPEAILERFYERLDLKLINQTRTGPATARNNGARHARGQFLAFTDDDCCPSPDWLKSFSRRFAAVPDWLLGGRTVNALVLNSYSAASQILIDYLYKYHNERIPSPSFFASNNIAMPASLFHGLAGFDGRFPRAAAEDRDFCDRWLRQGHRMAYVPEAMVYHSHELSIRGYWRQHFNYGRGAYHFHRLRCDRTQARIKLEPLSFYLSLLYYPFKYLRGKRAWTVSMLLSLSQIANAAGFFWETTQRHQSIRRTGDGRSRLHAS